MLASSLQHHRSAVRAQPQYRRQPEPGPLHLPALRLLAQLPGQFAHLQHPLGRGGFTKRQEAAAGIDRQLAIDGKFAMLEHPVALVLGGIYGGLFTATEAGGIGAAGALVLALARRIDRKAFYNILEDTVSTTAVLFAMIIGASIFTEFINYTGAHKSVLHLVQDSGLSPLSVIFLIIATYIVLGCVLDSLAMMLLTLPLFFPIVTGLGYDPVWFGILIVMLMELGLITPPIGINLFVLKTIIPEVPLATIIRGIVPFVVADVGRIALLVAIPGLALWLPQVFFS